MFDWHKILEKASKKKDETPCCPKCESLLGRDSADIGVGVIYGPWGCFNCGWSEWDEYDCSEGAPEADKNTPGYTHNPLGVAYKENSSGSEDKIFGFEGF